MAGGKNVLQGTARTQLEKLITLFYGGRNPLRQRRGKKSTPGPESIATSAVTHPVPYIAERFTKWLNLIEAREGICPVKFQEPPLGGDHCLPGRSKSQPCQLHVQRNFFTGRLNPQTDQL